jgi:hypothetical protein
MSGNLSHIHIIYVDPETFGLNQTPKLDESLPTLEMLGSHPEVGCAPGIISGLQPVYNPYS